MAEIDTNINSIQDYYKTLYPDIHINDDSSVKLYSSTTAEYDALINGAGMRDISFMGLIELKGKDTLDFVHRISTNKILGLAPYSSVNTIFTNEKGRIIDRTLLLNLDFTQLLVSSGVFRHKLLTWINKYIIVEDIKISVANNRYSLFELIGSQSESFLTMIFGKDIALKYNEIKKVNIERAEYFCVKINEFGLTKYLLLSNAEDTMFLLRYMHENSSVFDFRMVGEEAYNILRVEKGIPSAPNELNDFYNPHETKLINEVSFTKGCYIGQEVIARLDTYDKVQRELSLVLLDRLPETPENLSIYHNANEAGKITSIVYSHAHKQPMGLAYIRKEYFVNGNQFTAKDSTGAAYSVILKALPVIQ